MNPTPFRSHVTSAHVGLARTTASAPPRSMRLSTRELPQLAGLSDPARYLAAHSRSFQFAASMMSPAHQARVARVYAWCRYTDNLVDSDVSSELAERRLDAWLALSRAGYEGRDTGIELVNRVMGEMAESEVPFAYAHELVRAMRSDLHFTEFCDLLALRVYTYRAAGVVGRWLTELHGVRDAWILERATALGQAMQLTNILRDVGEDLARGRIYLPATELARHGLNAGDLEAMRAGKRSIDTSYRAMMEGFIELADADYRLAAEAIPHLPAEFRRAAAVASAVYRGIHGAIRRNGHDNLRRRAYTGGGRKVLLAIGALASLVRPRTDRRHFLRAVQ